MSKDETLAECLEILIDQDASIEELAAKHPAQQEELVELLGLAHAIHTMDQVSPRAEFVENAAQRLVAKLPDRNITYREPTRPRKRRRQVNLNWRPRFSFVQVALVLVFALIVTTGGTAFAANDAVPGDILYRVDLTIEQVLLYLTFSDEAAAKARLKIADERLLEATKVLAFGDVRNGNAALAAYENEIAAVAKLIGGKTGADKDKLSELLEIALAKHKAVLEGLLEKLPDQALFGVNHAIDASSKSKTENTTGPPEDKSQGPPEDKPQGPPEDKTTGKPDDKPQGPPEDKTTGKPDDKIKDDNINQ